MAGHQAPPSLGFSRQEHWSGLPFPSPMHESEKWKWSRSVAQSCLTFATPWTAAYQAPLSKGFPRQEYWSGLPLPSPAHLGMQKPTLGSSLCWLTPPTCLLNLLFPTLIIVSLILFICSLPPQSCLGTPPRFTQQKPLISGFWPCSTVSHTLTWILALYTHSPLGLPWKFRR